MSEGYHLPVVLPPDAAEWYRDRPIRATCQDGHQFIVTARALEDTVPGFIRCPHCVRHADK